MEFMEFFKTRKRMCAAMGGECHKCGLTYLNNGRDRGCWDFILQYPAEAEEVVAKWAAEHPVKTRQSEFLKMFPNARILPIGCVAINPCMVDAALSEKCKAEDTCINCGREYWLGEVE